MAYLLKVLVAKPNNLSSIPGANVKEGENQFSHMGALEVEPRSALNRQAISPVHFVEFEEWIPMYNGYHSENREHGVILGKSLRPSKEILSPG